MRSNNRGFTLVELLVVVAIFGIVVTAILDLNVNVMRSTVTSEELVEVQQGLRIALEQMARDIKMSGFLVQTPLTPIAVASNTQISLNTASAFNSFARIAPPDVTNPATSFAAGTPVAQTINVSSAAMAQLFTTGSFVRIVQPMTGNLLGDAFTVTGVNTPALPASSSLRLLPTANLPAVVNFVPGDLIVQVPSPTDDSTFPNVVTYQLVDDPASADPLRQVLSRIWRMGLPTLTAVNRDTNERVFATNITALRFEYLLDDGTVAPAPAAAPGTALTAAQRATIVAVRIFLTGLTAQAKTRELQTTVKIRNI